MDIANTVRHAPISPRSRRMMLFAPWMLLVTSCGSMQAEVGSDPPRDSGSGVGDGPSSRKDASDGPGSDRCDSRAALRLYYRNLRVGASSTDINYIVKVENATGAAMALSSLEVRYYLTNELPSSATIDVFYTDTCCSNKRTDFSDSILSSLQSLPAKPNADVYLPIAFAPTAGSLADGDAVQVEIGFHDIGYARSLVQTNDYSYAATAAGTQAEWDACPGPQCESKFTSCALTVHADGLLVWGAPP